MTELAGGQKHGPRFDALASRIAEMSGGEVPTSVGAISAGNINGGQALVKFAKMLSTVSVERGLPISRGHETNPPVGRDEV